MTLPSEIRKVLKIDVGDRVLWNLENDQGVPQESDSKGLRIGLCKDSCGSGD